MLDLNNPIVYTDEEKAIIDTIMASGKSGKDMWNATPKELKNRISIHTIEEQGCRCAYCEALLLQGTTEIEHFVSKGKHRRFTFEPLNLFSVCKRCNSPAVKGQKETIKTPEKSEYSSNDFLIVHPRLANPDNEIKFINDKRVYFDKPNCTQLGLDTISFFKWDDMDAVSNRIINSNRAGIPMNIQEYALLVSTYKQ